jgi:hypothetical protein
LAASAVNVLVFGSAGVAVAQGPTKVIDAGANATEAADALNQGCVDMHKCDFKSDTALSTVYAPARIIGDVLYNCSADAPARTAVGVSDERGESTSISESISLDISFGFLDLEEQSLEFSAFSRQSQRFATEVTVSNSVPVAAGFKGWTQASVLSAGVRGSAYITQGIDLIQVKNIDLRFPGYQGPDSGGTRAQVVYSGMSQAMTPAEVDTYCGALPGTASAAAAAQTRRPRTRMERFKLNVCRAPSKDARRRAARCAKRAVTGFKKPPALRGVTAKLTRAGRVYAADNGRRGGVRLTQRRTITPGRYHLVMREKPRNMIVRKNGKRLHRAKQHMVTIVPLTIRWTRRM